MSWMRRLLNTLRRRALDREIEDELQFHVESRATDLQRAGLSADDARREARRLLGNDASLRDRTREAEVWVRLETALQDMRYAAAPCGARRSSPRGDVDARHRHRGQHGDVRRGLRRSRPAAPVRGRRSPVPAVPDERPRRADARHAAGLRRPARAGPFDTDGGRRGQRVYVHRPRRSGARRRPPGERRVLQPPRRDAGVRSHVRSRGGSRGDERPDRPEPRFLAAAIRRRPSIVGRTITANNRSYTVVGVMGPDFSFQGTRYQFWVPLPLAARIPTSSRSIATRATCRCSRS